LDHTLSSLIVRVATEPVTQAFIDVQLGASMACSVPVRTEARYSVTLKTSAGKYVVAEGGGGSNVLADRTGIGPWEMFTLTDTNFGALRSGDLIHLQANTGQYVVADGGGAVRADQARPDTAETFRIGKSGTDPVIRDGDQITLRAYNGQYLSVTGADRTAIQASGLAGAGDAVFTVKIYMSAATPD
jgi:hypothetical protein